MGRYALVRKDKGKGGQKGRCSLNYRRVQGTKRDVGYELKR